jgi:hypothetical protein
MNKKPYPYKQIIVDIVQSSTKFAKMTKVACLDQIISGVDNIHCSWKAIKTHDSPILPKFVIYFLFSHSVTAHGWGDNGSWKHELIMVSWSPHIYHWVSKDYDKQIYLLIRNLLQDKFEILMNNHVYMHIYIYLHINICLCLYKWILIYLYRNISIFIHIIFSL